MNFHTLFFFLFDPFPYAFITETQLKYASKVRIVGRQTLEGYTHILGEYTIMPSSNIYTPVYVNLKNNLSLSYKGMIL